MSFLSPPVCERKASPASPSNTGERPITAMVKLALPAAQMPPNFVVSLKSQPKSYSILVAGSNAPVIPSTKLTALSLTP